MHRLLLADDDTIVRMYLSEIVPWKDYEIEVVGAARDGLEALEMARELQPDVILADISMPRLDGIGMITRLRAEDFHGVIDVLSCHDDFDMVKSAMQQGADDYLLKNHLTEKNIGDIAGKICAQVVQRHKQFSQDRQIRHMANRGRNVIRQEFLDVLLKGNLSPEEAERQKKNVGITGKFDPVVALVMKLLGAERDQTESFQGLCTQALNQEETEIMLLGDDALVIFLDTAELSSAQKTVEMVANLQNRIRRIAEQYLNLEVAFAISNLCYGKTAMADALRQANSLIGHSFYGAGSWQYSTEQPLTSVPTSEAQKFVDQLPTLLENTEDDQLLGAAGQALEENLRQRISREALEEWLRKCDAAAGYERPEEDYSNRKTPEDYIDFAEPYLAARRDRLNQIIPKNVSPAIRTAILYIYNHFNESISLTVVSNQANLSMTYFSTLFKQEVGCGFSEFLTNVRLEWVCKKIVSTNETLKKVSEEAGFADYPYFCKTFKKAYGVSPAEYRKNG